MPVVNQLASTQRLTTQQRAQCRSDENLKPLQNESAWVGRISSRLAGVDQLLSHQGCQSRQPRLINQLKRTLQLS